MDPALFDEVSCQLADFHRRFAPLFGRPEARRRSAQYLRGLLVQQTDRRNAENLAEAIPGAAPRALQRFLTEAPWDAEAVIAELQAYLAERLTAPDAVFILDETGFPKQGTRSVGVARQYCGTLGKIGNCQIGVSVRAVGAKGTAPLGWALYLPQEWCEDPERRRRAKIPSDVAFKRLSENSGRRSEN